MASVFGAGPVLLDSPEKMLAVLKELSGADASVWRGQIDVWNLGESAVWRIELNNDLGPGDGNTVSAVLGEYLVLTYGRLLKLSADEV